MAIRNSDHHHPAGLDNINLDLLIEAWEAWEKHGSQPKAAKALGIPLSTMGSRILRYRRHVARRPAPRSAAQERRAALALEAWQAWEEYGSISEAARRLGLTYSGFRSRLESYWDAHGLRHGIAPKSLHDWGERQDAAAWAAWQEHGTHRAAAKALGVSTYTVSRRCKGHRLTTGMPDNATPTTHTPEGKPRWQVAA